MEMTLDELRKKSVADLREIAKLFQIDTKGMKKEEILKAISGDFYEKKKPTEKENNSSAPVLSAEKKENAAKRKKAPAVEKNNSTDRESPPLQKKSKRRVKTVETAGEETEAFQDKGGAGADSEKTEKTEITETNVSSDDKTTEGKNNATEGSLPEIIHTESNGAEAVNKTDNDITADNETDAANEALPEKTVEFKGVYEPIQDGKYGFVRIENYYPGNNDCFVPPVFIKKYGLRIGDIISGKAVFIQREKGTNCNVTQIYEINGIKEADYIRQRPQFEHLVPVYPDKKLTLETDKKSVSTRIIDLFCPIGFGQRGLIVSPPKAGKTVLLKEVATSIIKNNPSMEVIILLVDERPEEVTDMKDSVPGATVVSSTFDEQPEHHVKVAELVLESAMRVVESGKNVVVLLDSITRLARAYNMVITPTGRSLSGGLDPGALYKPKRFFGAARNIRGGGSLTIIATALVDTGSKLDDVIYEEFKGTGNMEIHLDRKIAERRIFPAIDIMKSGTRKEELLLTKEELDGEYFARHRLIGMNVWDATETAVKAFNQTRNNAEMVDRLLIERKNRDN